MLYANIKVEDKLFFKNIVSSKKIIHKSGKADLSLVGSAFLFAKYVIVFRSII